MKYVINLESFIVEANSEEDAKREASKVLDNSPDLLVESIELL